MDYIKFVYFSKASLSHYLYPLPHSSEEVVLYQVKPFHTDSNMNG